MNRGILEKTNFEEMKSSRGWGSNYLYVNVSKKNMYEK